MRTALTLLLALLAVSLWAADISGTWDCAVQLDAGSGNVTFVFKQDGEKLTGTYSGLLGKRDLTGTVKGDQVEFQFEASYEGQSFTVRYSGTIEGAAKMKGKTTYGDQLSGTWTATRQQ